MPKAWEQAFFATPVPHVRKVAIRSAMTFGAGRGGVFDVFSGLVRRGLGGPQGPGTQFVSWIHEADFARGAGPALALGFEFFFPQWPAAARELVARSR